MTSFPVALMTLVPSGTVRFAPTSLRVKQQVSRSPLVASYRGWVNVQTANAGLYDQTICIDFFTYYMLTNSLVLISVHDFRLILNSSSPSLTSSLSTFQSSYTTPPQSFTPGSTFICPTDPSHHLSHSLFSSFSCSPLFLFFIDFHFWSCAVD